MMLMGFMILVKMVKRGISFTTVIQYKDPLVKPIDFNFSNLMGGCSLKFVFSSN